MSALRVVGVDPGPVPGIAVLEIDDGQLQVAEVLQCSAGAVDLVVWALLADAGKPVLLATETFVAGRRASRSSTAGAGATTRDMVGQLTELGRRHGTTFVQRPAGAVKPWATDARLERAGLLDLCKGMRHARDGARHALYAAVHGGHLPDPLSKDWTR